ncbi:levanase-like [Sitodiplosis mosellana]|uniref:levanase-like n=1 Tax=Sitodiplosis mosellana TaxID=263140 RepID=UPI0024438D8B|nr:levanase-like [Sitodiplosis mosellana]WEI57631.1 putative GH32 family protein [Sitodiplosis mosellana]
MFKSNIVRLLLLFSICYCELPVNGQSYKEKNRLQLHYSIPSGWSNDPNGLIYAGGYYQLYFQYNPVDTVFGPMHWGHARSPDLIHWENMPIALKPYEKGVIYSGCAILDKNNVTGFAALNNSDASSTALIALYTLDDNKNQSQALAYSFDNGTTWTQYEANPVIPNQGILDFRDPNVFERDGKFYVTLAVLDHIEFYVSSNLLSWEKVTDFGVSPDEGLKIGVWECPALLTLADEHGNKHDILIVSMNDEVHGSRTQYFIGQFNGSRFNTYDKSRILWIDNGFDNYAAVPYPNDPAERVVLIGWLSNWLYAQNVTASTWRGQMTIPREMGLRTIDGALHVIQQPVVELNNIIDPARNWTLSEPFNLTGNHIMDVTSKIPFNTGSQLILNYEFDIEQVENGQIDLRFGNTKGEFVSFNYNVKERTYGFDRSNSGDVAFHPGFAGPLQRIKRISSSQLLSGKILLDTASIEIFADDGLNTISALFFPSELLEKIHLRSSIDAGKSVKVSKLRVAALKSIWSNNTMSSHGNNMNYSPQHIFLLLLIIYVCSFFSFVSNNSQ